MVGDFKDLGEVYQRDLTSADIPSFDFQLPALGGGLNSLRQRLKRVSFEQQRSIRVLQKGR